jgi:hypothetical protein
MRTDPGCGHHRHPCRDAKRRRYPQTERGADHGSERGAEYGVDPATLRPDGHRPTVDELVDKLSSGGIKVGDQFRMTGELVGSDYWMIRASGDFLVMLKTTEGSDLQVFIDESDANGWQDGTKVEMVVKMVERTIDDETTDGFFEAVSAKTISEGTTKKAKVT